jgi:hypothetical protein
MSERKPSTGKRHARAFVPKLTLKRAAVAVVPLCAAGMMAACSGDDDDTSPTMFTVAATGFDAGRDATGDATTVVIALAVSSFDAALDHATADAADAADAGDSADATDAADAADGAD